MSRLSWLGLAAAALVGLGITLLVRRKTRALTSQAEAQAEAEARAQAPAPTQAPAPAQAPASREARVPTEAGAQAGAGAQRDQAGAGAGAPHSWGRTEPDRMAGRREGG